MKVLLINVRYDERKYRYRVNKLCPPLGIAYIAGILRSGGHDVSILDMEALRMEYESLPGHLATENPDIIGVHGTTPTSPYIKQAVEIVEGPKEGFARNFLSLIDRFADNKNMVMFADQDDIWEDTKIERAVTAVGSFPFEKPVLYGSASWVWNPTTGLRATSCSCWTCLARCATRTSCRW